MDADRNLALKAEGQRVLSTIVDRACAMGETGTLVVSVDIFRGQLRKVVGLKQTGLMSVADDGNGRLIEKAKGAG